MYYIRGCLLFLFITYAAVCYSQNYVQKELNWTSVEKKISPEEKMNLMNILVKGIYYDSSYYGDTVRVHYGDKEFEKYHPVELNGDTLIDIIYEGRNPPGMETNNYSLFINNGESYYLAWNNYSLVDTLIFQENKLIKMQSVSYPCCANYIFVKDYYTIKQKEFPEGIACILDSSEALGYCETPQKISLNIGFITTVNKYLTFDPAPVKNKGKITPDDMWDMAYPGLGNNQIGIIKAGSEGIILAKKINRNKTYYFIRIKNKTTLQSIFDKEDLIIYGWVKEAGINFK